MAGEGQLSDRLRRCADEILRRLERGILVALTGSGVSAESGIPTFRDRGGLWDRWDPEQVATAEALQKRPRMVWRFFQELRELAQGARPNAAHYALAELESLLRAISRVVVITQNVDGLHQAAGSRTVIELHGNAGRYYCMVCGREHPAPPLTLGELPPRCACGGVIRPDVVFFGEMLPEDAWSEAAAAVERSAVMLVVGTSLQVEPAASLAYQALQRGALVCQINLEPTPLSHLAHYTFLGPASRLLPALVQRVRELLSERTPWRRAEDQATAQASGGGD